MEARVGPAHPLRQIRLLVNEVLAQLDRAFDRLYADGAPPPSRRTRLLPASLLQLFYSTARGVDKVTDNEITASRPVPK